MKYEFKEKEHCMTLSFEEMETIANFNRIWSNIFDEYNYDFEDMWQLLDTAEIMYNDYKNNNLEEYDDKLTMRVLENYQNLPNLRLECDIKLK